MNNKYRLQSVADILSTDVLILQAIEDTMGGDFLTDDVGSPLFTAWRERDIDIVLWLDISVPGKKGDRLWWNGAAIVHDGDSWAIEETEND